MNEENKILNSQLKKESYEVRSEINQLVYLLNAVNERIEKNPYDNVLLSQREALKEKIEKLKYKRRVLVCKWPFREYTD